MAYLFIPIIVIVAILFVAAIFHFMPKRACCKLGWHSFRDGFESVSFDGCSEHARCKWCNYEGMIDSQGNLF